MGRHVLSDAAYTRVADEAKAAGSATHRGEQRQREGKGLDPLVDPSGYDVIRRSLSWYEPEGDQFTLLRGVAMLEETRLDTTGSMGTNVEIAMRVLPTTYKLLATGENAVLKRYDTQMITSIFGDVVDKYVLCRSQAEMDERIAEQMTLMLPEGGGGDSDEDPQYGIFGGAYLTKCSINDYDLKRYDITISDARGRHSINHDTLVRIYGASVLEKVAENGFQMTKKNLPSTKEAVVDLLKSAHAFFLQVRDNPEVTRFWTEIYGKERVVMISRTEFLPYVKAVIIGLTEGVLDLKSVEDFLKEEGHRNLGAGKVSEKFAYSLANKLNKDDITEIKRSVSHIPIGAQAALPNFDKLPLKGAVFAKKGDLWPIEGGGKSKDKPAPKGKGKKDDMWL